MDVTNKNVQVILHKMIKLHKNWHLKLLFALCGYQASLCTSTRAIPYSSVYEMEAVLPIELKIKSLRDIKER